jgi:uncharacterized protein (TIGR03435 family)
MGSNFRWLVVLGVFSSGLHAQDIVGAWQGTFAQPGGGSLRVVAKVDRDAGGTLGATLYNADRSAPAIPASTISFQGSTLKMTLPTINATYTGKLSADGTTIVGAMTQGGPVPLDFARSTPATAWAVPDPPSQSKPMAEDVTPGIEVATVKPSRPDARGGGVQVSPGGTVTAINAPLNMLIAMAYGVDQRQLGGGPSWIESDNFDITFKPDHEGAPNRVQLRQLWQALLADRFALKAHIEKKEQPVYALSVLKSGLKMTKVDPPRGNLPGFGVGPSNIRVNNATMDEFANLLSHVVGRPVVDRTGIAGRYDCLLRFMPSAAELAQLPKSDLPPEDAAPDVYAAIERQGGLHLESTKAPVDFVLIDKVETPSGN